MVSRLEQALARFRRGREAAQEAAKPPTGRGGDAFRVRVEERLRNLEQQVSEIKGRVNGLIFLVAGTALTQVIIKVLQ
ncbi:MAG TPA: hypothetical protein VJ578_06015 [Dehalococcoidia bacterium]|nr:hypothetical protein [Dehalococcoidia bacterium]